MYFEKVKAGENVFGFIYGKGQVDFVVNEQYDLDGFYAFSVVYECGERVFYSKDGVPNWCTNGGCVQTVFYVEDIDFMDEDFSPSDEDLAPKKIMKLFMKGKLEMKCPSGFWRNTEKCPPSEVTKAISMKKQ